MEARNGARASGRAKIGLKIAALSNLRNKPSGSAAAQGIRSSLTNLVTGRAGHSCACPCDGSKVKAHLAKVGVEGSNPFAQSAHQLAEAGVLPDERDL